MDRKKMLIVEDDVLAAASLAEFLSEREYVVVGTAKNGESALAMAESLGPDLILMDIGLGGGLDGIETARRLKAAGGHAIVFVTARSDFETIERARAIHPFGILLKPFAPPLAGAIIAMACERVDLERARAAEVEDKRAREEELRIAHEGLTAINRRFSSVINSLPDPLYLIDAEDYSISLRNKASREIDGGGERLGMTCFSLSHGRDSPCEGRNHECPLERVKRTGESCTIEHRHQAPDGSWKDIEIYAHPVFDEEGKVAQVIEYSMDITKRKAMDAAFRESEERLKSLFANVNEYIYSVDYREGKPVHRFDSPKCLEITGYSPEEMRANPRLWFEIIHEGDRKKVLDYIERVESGARERPIEHRVVRKDGRLVWVMNSYTVVRDAEGALKRTEGFILDMEERITMEHELIGARDAAEAANRAKSDFLASMSHELRTPLNSILGFSQLLVLEGSGNLTGRQKGYVRDIKESGEHLLGMIGDILDLSKIEAGKIEIVKKAFDLRATIFRLAETMGATAAKKGIVIALDLAPDLGILVADEVRIRQILYNLISNSIKFTPEGKRVGVTARGEGDHVRLTVWDEGIGIAEADRKRIFEPFEQVHRAEGVNLGTGLGLAITTRLVALHSGRVGLESDSGKGSHFTVELPGRVPERRVFANSEAKGQTLPEPPAGKTGILVVEDNPVNRKLMKAMLEGVGHAAHFASSGEEAVEMASSRSFDLVFMDINLPGIDGIEAMKRIRRGHSADGSLTRRESDKPTRFVALTAHAMKGDSEHFIAEGMDEVLTKPIEMERLASLLEKFAGEEPRTMEADSPQETEEFGGIDEARGLLLLGGNEALFAEMLDMFAATYASFVTDLLPILDQTTTIEARRLVHSLKGAAANLGLRDVEAAAKILEAKLAAGESTAANDPPVLSLEKALAVVVDSIAKRARI
ncbi:MAG TPA: response regulator [Rectinemataceae bacterium]|nr:response regulator [Rectinemataceae bacterium]